MRCSKHALEWLATHELDVVLTDINMPRLEAFGLIRKLRENALHSDRPILSADERSLGGQESARQGCRRDRLDREAV